MDRGCSPPSAYCTLELELALPAAVNVDAQHRKRQPLVCLSRNRDIQFIHVLSNFKQCIHLTPNPVL